MHELIAYIDPSSGGQILTIIAGGLAAVAVTLRMYWHRLLVFLRIRKPDETQPTNQSAATKEEAKTGAEAR